MIRQVQHYFLLIFLLCAGTVTRAQNITGTWEGIMSDEFMQVNIIQQNDQLCGYTYDIVLGDKSSYCKAYFKGKYDRESGIWTIFGISFIRNSGNHVLMTLRFWRNAADDKNTLRGMVSLRSSFSDYLGFGEGERFFLRKKSSRPQKLPGNLPTCYEEKKPPQQSPVKKDTASLPAPVKKKIPAVPLPPKKATKPVITKKPVIKKPASIPVKKDTVAKPVKISFPVSRNIKEESIIKKMEARKKTEVSRLIVNVRNIELKVYDNGIVDNDTVSIFYNGKLLRGKQRLSETPLLLNITLDENTTMHEIVMFADNLGSIPPNTAIIVVTAGDKRYELRSSASLEENAVLFFEYQPGQKK